MRKVVVDQPRYVGYERPRRSFVTSATACGWVVSVPSSFANKNEQHYLLVLYHELQYLKADSERMYHSAWATVVVHCF